MREVDGGKCGLLTPAVAAAGGAATNVGGSGGGGGAEMLEKAAEPASTSIVVGTSLIESSPTCSEINAPPLLLALLSGSDWNCLRERPTLDGSGRSMKVFQALMHTVAHHPAHCMVVHVQVRHPIKLGCCVGSIHVPDCRHTKCRGRNGKKYRQVPRQESPASHRISTSVTSW